MMDGVPGPRSGPSTVGTGTFEGANARGLGDEAPVMVAVPTSMAATTTVATARAAALRVTLNRPPAPLRPSRPAIVSHPRLWRHPECGRSSASGSDVGHGEAADAVTVHRVLVVLVE